MEVLKDKVLVLDKPFKLLKEDTKVELGSQLLPGFLVVGELI